MRFLKKILFLVLAVAAFTGFSQSASGQSQLFLFADRDYCISGDTVWFKVKIRNGELDNSNVVHVQLHSGNSGLIAGIKKKSTDNWASGFIPVPDSLSTGVYFISAFLNAQRSDPQGEIVTKTLFVYNRFNEEITEMQVPVPERKLNVTDFNHLIPVKTAKKTYAPREKVKVDIGLNEIDTSVIKQVVVRASHVDGFATDNGGRVRIGASFSKPSVPHIEEKDGFLLSGHVTVDSSGEPADGIIVLLSLFGEMPYLDYYLTGDNGNFHFFLKNAFGVANIVLQAVSPDNREFNIRVDKNYLVGEKMNFHSLQLTPGQSELIANAIDGAYYNKMFGGTFILEKDTFFMPARFGFPFYGEPDKRVVPADFFELPNFREISRELLHGIQYRVHDDGITIRLLNEKDNIYFASDPLRLINGIPIYKNSLLAPLRSIEIDYIEYVQKERLYGDLNFKGILSVSLKNKSNSWMTRQPNFFRVSVLCFQPDKQPGYHNPASQVENLPDIRPVNFWQKMETGTTRQLEFCLSDLKGNVEISVEGVTGDGTFFKAAKIIEVK